MTGRTLLDRLQTRWQDFRKANAANVTMTFALAMVPTVGLVGAAVDYSRANSVKAAMQAAADSTALFLSKDAATMSTTALQTKADAYFKALFSRSEAKDLKVTATYTGSGGSEVLIHIEGDVMADFMNIIGLDKMKVAVNSTVKWGNTKMRVALALDTTGSMNDDGKMDALKVATKSLLTTLKNAATTNGDVYVSIIPFSKSVNVGKSKVNESWIKWSGSSDTFDEVEGKCRSYDGNTEPKTKSKCTQKDGRWTSTAHDKWNGCIMDRDQDYDIKNTAPNFNKTETLFPAEQYESCPAEMMGLSYDWNTLTSKVDSLYPAGNTNQIIGLAWAFQSLTAAPFVIPAKDGKFKYQDVIILVTDGDNTETRHSTTKSTMDARELLACANAKAAGITVYTLQINTGGDATQTFLQTCASAPDKFIEVKKSSQVLSAFNSIGTSLSNLRIAR